MLSVAVGILGVCFTLGAFILVAEFNILKQQRITTVARLERLEDDLQRVEKALDARFKPIEQALAGINIATEDYEV